MSTATNGRAREHRISKLMCEHGWLQIMRAAASKGPADLAMLHPFLGLAWVQVGAPSKEFRCLTKGCEHGGGTGAQCARDRLCSVAEQTHALALLATSGPGVPTRFFEVTREPASKWKEWTLQ
jgi:hypothetical protein